MRIHTTEGAPLGSSPTRASDKKSYLAELAIGWKTPLHYVSPFLAVGLLQR